MLIKSMSKALAVLLALSAGTASAEAIDADPCLGPNALLSVVDRPSNSDSACAVPMYKSVIEMGTQYNKIYTGGTGYDLPEAEYRFGLPWKSELFVLLPNYFHQSVSPRAGFGATAVGLKHETTYDAKMQTAVEAEVILPTGSQAFGSQSAGVIANGILSYSFTEALNVTFQLGIGNEAESNLASGQRFTTVNPDLVLTYNILDVLDVYGEVYGQSRTAPKQGSGFNCDGGFIYLVNKNVTVDVEVGQRISGNLQGFQHYIGAGGAVKF